MSALPYEFELGGCRARWVWVLQAEGHPSTDGHTGAALTQARPARSVLPAGVVIDHGDHNLMVAWVPTDDAAVPFTLDSMLPLSIEERVSCPHCGVEGFINEGAWLPVEVSP